MIPYGKDYDENGREVPQVGVYTDIAALLAGKLELPEPDLLTRLDGKSLLYSHAVNGLFGEAESGKTWIALAAIVEELRSRDAKVLFIDLDHNGAKSVVVRLIGMGAATSVLSDQDRFRYADPEDALAVHGIIADCEQWRPSLVVIDSVGELVPMFKGDSNSSDDYTGVHRKTAARLAKLGACVVLIDHVAKSAESAAKGPIGAGAKRRAIDGAYLRVTLRSAFTPGKGGSAVISVNKDRHGAVREHAHLDEGKREPIAGIFEMGAGDADRISWKVRAPLAGERPGDTAPLADVTALAQLVPPPGNVRDVKDRMQWGSARASAALRAFNNNEHLTFPVPEEQPGNGEPVGDECVFPVPVPLPPESGEHSDQHKQGSVPRVFSDVPGGVTANTPGMTDRVAAIVAAQEVNQ